ncbi:MAG: DMT family transporter [Planctomycetota bacterium]|nr:MAG: DMT family transporter [Planctomycetota bacterium]
MQASPAPFPGVGEICALTNALAWGLSTIVYRLAMDRKIGTAGEIALFKNAIGLVVLVALSLGLGPELGGGLGAWSDVPWLLLAGISGMAVGDFLYFVAVHHLGVGRTLILNQGTPVLTALAAWPLFGETLNTGQVLGMILVVAGGMVAESRRMDRTRADWIGILAVFSSMLCYTLANVASRPGLDQTGPVAGAAWRLVGGAAAMWWLQSRSRKPDQNRPVLWRRPQVWSWFLAPTLIGTVGGLFLLNAGLKWAKQGVAASLSAALPLFTVPLAVWILHERPGRRGWLGVLLVVMGVALLGLSLSSNGGNPPA